MIKSDFVAKSDLNKCINCGTCVSWCYFGARGIDNGKLQFNPIKCFGCGICVSKCPNHAIILFPKN